MSRTYKDSPHSKQLRGRRSRTRQRHISVRAVRRDPPDLRKLSRALIALAMAEAEAAAQQREQGGNAAGGSDGNAPEASDA